MSFIYSCDRCGDTFGGPLDQIPYQGKGYDLCVPCRTLRQILIDTAEKKFFEEVENG